MFWLPPASDKASWSFLLFQSRASISLGTYHDSNVETWLARPIHFDRNTFSNLVSMCHFPWKCHFQMFCISPLSHLLTMVEATSLGMPKAFLLRTWRLESYLSRLAGDWACKPRANPFHGGVSGWFPNQPIEEPNAFRIWKVGCKNLCKPK